MEVSTLSQEFVVSQYGLRLVGGDAYATSFAKGAVYARPHSAVQTSIEHGQHAWRQGLEFHGRNPQTWILYVLNTFPQRVGAFDVLNPAHHRHIGVGLCILFFEVIFVVCRYCVMNSSL